jgi:hypothetical protein
MKASNIQAMVRTIAVHRRPVSAALPYAQGLTIRISKTIWNICESQKNPQTHRVTQTTSRSDQRRRKKRPGKTTTREASEFAVESAKRETAGITFIAAHPLQSEAVEISLWSAKGK